MSSPRARLGAVVGPVLLAALVMASCGADDGAASVTTIDLSSASTAFVVRPPATTAPAETSVPAEGEVVTTEQEYVVQSGDTPIGVATKFGISVDDLIAYNEWGPGEFAFPGDTIRIPPGGTAPATDTATTEDAAAEDDTAESGDTIPDAGDNCAEGSYTIAAGDTPLGVARKFDVTVDALNAANAGTTGYGGFIVGVEIVIPAKSDC
jgi:LysM repeat protein